MLPKRELPNRGAVPRKKTRAREKLDDWVKDPGDEKATKQIL